LSLENYVASVKNQLKLVGSVSALNVIKVEDVFPKASMFGCAFHWTQAVFRRLKKIELVNLYNQKGELYILLKKLLSLHLPIEKIPKMFADLKSQSLSLDVTSTQANLLKKFFDYVEKQWITNPIWPTTKWW
jgi:hypothetical protein